MSKEAALRAMREARYTARQAGTSRQGQAAVRPAQRTAAPTAPPAASTGSARDAAPEPATDGLCGHRSMNGRTCTREHGHAAKSHRYS